MAVNKFIHTQVTPSTSWVIHHNLGVLTPIVELATTSFGTAEKIYPSDIVFVDTSTVEIVWSKAYAGTATIVG